MKEERIHEEREYRRGTFWVGVVCAVSYPRKGVLKLRDLIGPLLAWPNLELPVVVAAEAHGPPISNAKISAGVVNINGAGTVR